VDINIVYPYYLPLVIKPKVVKGSSAMEIWAARASAELCQSRRTDRSIVLAMRLLNSCWMVLSFKERLTWRNPTDNSSRFWLFVTASAAAFLYEGNVWAYDQLSLLFCNTRKNKTSQESKPCICPIFLKSPIL